MMRVIKRILLFPVVIMLGIARLVLQTAVKIETRAAGLIFFPLGLMAIYVLINGRWKEFTIFAVLFAVLVVIMLSSASILAIIEGIKERIR